MPRFQLWHLLTLFGVFCFIAGTVRLFASVSTPLAFQLTIYVLLLVVSPALAYCGVALFSGTGRAFCIGGALFAAIPWCLGLMAMVSLLPNAFASPAESIPSPFVWGTTLNERIRELIVILSPWLSFLVGGSLASLIYLLLSLFFQQSARAISTHAPVRRNAPWEEE